MKLATWPEDNHVELEFIRPGKPTQNSCIERFNRTFRDEILAYYIFHRLSEVRAVTDNWVIEHNEIMPHESLGKQT